MSLKFQTFFQYYNGIYCNLKKKLIKQDSITTRVYNLCSGSLVHLTQS